MNKKNKKLAIFGPYPPPLGGISVHIQRIEKHLINEEIDYTIFDHYANSGKNIIATHKNPLRYLKFLFDKKYALFHFHQMFLTEYVFYYLFSKLNTTPFIITIHGETLLKINKGKQKAILWLLKKTSNYKLLSVSKNIQEFFTKNDIEVEYLPAYIPSAFVNKKNIPKGTRHYFLFSIWKLESDNAESVYNIRLAFEFLKREKEHFKMVFMIGNKESSDLKYLNDVINEYGLQHDILLIYNESLIDYMHNFEFLLRTNFVDGYGVSLQEAMDLGIPAIASDVCERPKGTIVFKNNDIEDLISKVHFVRSVEREEILQKIEKLDFHLRLIKLYKSYLEK